MLEKSSYFFLFDYEVYEISFAEERIGAERPVDRICQNINWSWSRKVIIVRLCRECFVN